jgi:hypothetical protein
LTPYISFATVPQSREEIRRGDNDSKHIAAAGTAGPEKRC